MYSRLSFLMIIFVLGITPLGALAQESPSFNVIDLGPATLDQMAVKQISFKDALDKVENTEMRSVLQLQHEITMLNALTNWQDKIVRMQETYAKVGVDFFPPKPPRDVCEQVPANLVCGQAYPDLAPEAPVIVEAPTPQAPVIQTQKPKAQSKPAEAPINYEWADINCLGSDCKAVLVDLTSGARFGVLPGEQIEENVMVQAIKKGSVTLSLNGKAEELRPAIDSGKRTPIMADSQSKKGRTLEETLSGLPDIEPPTAPLVLDDGTGQNTNTTGLF